MERLVVDRSTREDPPVVVLFHGFMSSVDDLSPFADALGEARFVFPHAPIDLAPRGMRGRAYWIDVDVGAPEPRSAPMLHPEGLDEARAWVDAFLKELRAEHPRSRMIVGGFSQGAMLTFDWALRTAERPHALVQLSGAPMCWDEWSLRLPALAGQSVFFSHGRSDPDLAFHAIEKMQAEVAAAGWDVTFCPFDGGHEVPLVPLRALRRFMRGALR